MSKKSLTVACINALIPYHSNHSRVLDQSQRIHGFVEGLSSLPRPVDVVAMCEVQQLSDGRLVGDEVARLYDCMPGFWAPHKPGHFDHVGLFSQSARSKCTSYDLGGNKQTIEAFIGKTQFLSIHLKYGLLKHHLRMSQTHNMLASVEISDQCIMLGDFNSRIHERSRRTLKQAGFRSVFEDLPGGRPKTVPSDEFKSYLPWWQKAGVALAGGGFSPDDIYIKGFTVQEAGVFDVPSDHRGVWATLIQN